MSKKNVLKEKNCFSKEYLQTCETLIASLSVKKNLVVSLVHIQKKKKHYMRQVQNLIFYRDRCFSDIQNVLGTQVQDQKIRRQLTTARFLVITQQ